MHKQSNNKWILIVGVPLVFLAVFGARTWMLGLIDDNPVDSSANNTTANAQSRTDVFAGLSEEKQKIIWDAEHTTFELETHFGKPLTNALKARSTVDLEAFFVDNFSAKIPTDSGETMEHGAVNEILLNGDIELQSANSTETIEYLIGLLNDFEAVSKVKLRVLQITQAEDDLFNLELLLMAFGSKSELPIELELHSHAQVKFTNDEEIGVGKILKSMAVTSQSVRYTRQSLMEEVTKQTGLADLDIHDNWVAGKDATFPQHFQIAVEDFNKDGFPDIVVANAKKPPLLLRSVKGEQFENVAKELGIKSWKGTSQHFTFLVGWIDFDNDGYSDLLIGDSLYRNDKGEKFIPVDAGLKFRTQPSGCVVADYDCDGLLDLYVMYQSPTEENTAETLPWIGDHESGAPNELWRNEGNGRFTDVTKKMKAGGGARQSFAAAWMFMGDDKYPDLYIANDFGENVLLENDGSGAFKDMTHKLNVGDFATSMGVSAGDLNNDGKSEIYVGNMFSKMGRRIIAHVEEEDYPDGVYEGILGSCAGNRLYSLDADGTSFSEISEMQGVNQVGWTHGVAMGDFDGDGWLDLYSSAGYLSFHRDRPDG